MNKSFFKIVLCLALTAALLLGLCACSTPVESIDLDKKDVELRVGESFVMEYEVLPEDATDKTLSWSSSDEKVATVSEGKITALAAGECTITATSKEGITAICELLVLDPIVGTWVTDIDMSAMVTELLAAELGTELKSDVTLVMPAIFEFDDDMTYRLSIDEEAFADNFNVFLESIKEPMAEIVYASLEAQGISREDADAMFAAQGYTMDQLLDESLSELDGQALVAAMELDADQGSFFMEGGKLWTWDTDGEMDEAEYTVYTIEGDTMTFTEVVGDASNSDLAEFQEYGLLPMVLTRDD